MVSDQGFLFMVHVMKSLKKMKPGPYIMELFPDLGLELET